MTDSVETTAERGNRKVRQGTVISKSGDKTIVVQVERRYHHPLYGKQVRAFDKYHTHDEENKASVGDTVGIVECRPMSKMKRWRLVNVVKSGSAVE